MSVVKFLCIQGLAFRGKNELIGSSSNGKYLCILELLAEYGTFLAEDLRVHANKGRGHPSYMSSTICEEIIALMGQKALSVIVSDIKTAKYFSIPVDLSPVIAHVNQLRVVIRYVLKGGPVERFLIFIPMFSHTGVEIAKIVLQLLDEHGINIIDCRGQTYDNAANISGKYRGFQTIIREKCNVTIYIPCTAHSLILVGKNAVESCHSAAELFDLQQSIYSWLVASTHRWQIHRKFLDKLPVNKTLSDTRWSARYDAVHAVNRGFSENIRTLEELAANDGQPHESQIEAESFLKKLKQLETCILLKLWDTVLDQFQKINLSLQENGPTLNNAIHLLEALKSFVNGLRSDFEIYEEKGKKKSGVEEYKALSQRIWSRRRFFDEDPAEEIALSPREKFRVEVCLVNIDKLSGELEKRLTAYRNIENKFGFLSRLANLSNDHIQQAASMLMRKYPDFENHFFTELAHFAAFVRAKTVTVSC